MNATFAATLAETPAPVFLMSVAKPLITLATFTFYARLVAVTFHEDAAYYNLKPVRWASIFLGFAAAALLAVLLIPWWTAGFPLAVVLLVSPCVWYMRFREKALAGTKAKRLAILAIDFAGMAAARRAKSAGASVTLKFQTRDRTELPIPDRKDPAFEAYATLEAVLLPALEARASRIEIAHAKQGAQLQQTVDSVRYKRDPIAGELATRVVDTLKNFAGLEPGERRKFQRGAVAVVRGGEKTLLTVTSVGSMQGESIRIDVEREKQLTIPADKLGLLEPQMALLRSTMEAQPTGGVVLVGARPGNGLTALAYSLIGRHDAYTANIKTLEKRSERIVDGVEHSDFDPGKSDYATQLQTIVRRGPDVVFASDLAEAGVGKIVSAPNARSVVFYCGAPTDSVPELLQLWMKSGGDPNNASQALKMVLACRLLRKLCPTCRVAAAPTPAEAKLLAIPAGKQVQVFRPSGKVLVKEQPVDCPTCRGTGYLGVTGAFEVLPMDEESRTLLASGDVKGAYLQARRASKSLSLQDAALAKVRIGETSFDEVRRVFAAPAAAPGAPGAPGSAPAAPSAPSAAAAPQTKK